MYASALYYIAYKDLEDRNEVRQAAWEFPGWDECVMKTGEEQDVHFPFLLLLPFCFCLCSSPDTVHGGTSPHPNPLFPTEVTAIQIKTPLQNQQTMQCLVGYFCLGT